MMTRFQPFAPFPFEWKMDINGGPTSRRVGDGQMRVGTPAADLGSGFNAHKRIYMTVSQQLVRSRARSVADRLISLDMPR